MSERTPAENAIRAFPFWDYGMDDVSPKAKTAEWVAALATVVEKAVRAQVAAEIEAYEPTAHMVVCPPAIAWEAGREKAANIARYGGE